MKAGVNVILFTMLIPVSLHLLTERATFSKALASNYGAKASIVLLAIGSLAIGLSPQIAMLITCEYLSLPKIHANHWFYKIQP